MASSRSFLALILALGFLGFSLVAITPGLAADKLVVYSGRAERLIKPVLDEFRSRSGIQVELLSSGTTELVNRLQAESDRTPADVFLMNDAGSLERVRELQLLKPMIMEEVADNSWIGLSGRFWIVVYNTTLAKPDPITSLLDLAKPQWKDKIAIPNSGSEYLQAGVSVVKATFGDDRTKQFLEGLKRNAGSHVYQKSSQIVEAVAKGQVAVGIVNHYYVYRHLAAQSTAPIAALMPDQQEAGMGAIMNVSDIGITRAAKHVDSAKRLIEFLVAQGGQRLFADLNKEYPLYPKVKTDSTLVDRHSFRAALFPLARLAELRDPTLTLIEQVGLR